MVLGNPIKGHDVTPQVHLQLLSTATLPKAVNNRQSVQQNWLHADTEHPLVYKNDNKSVGNCETLNERVKNKFRDSHNKSKTDSKN